jgi:hypothetical protein
MQLPLLNNRELKIHISVQFVMLLLDILISVQLYVNHAKCSLNEMRKLNRSFDLEPLFDFSLIYLGNI